jgi:long-chain acyl-CoA synthetase
MNVAHLLTAAAAVRPEHPAFVFEEQALTYAQLDRLTDRFARVLEAHHVVPGEVVAIFLDSSPELVITCVGSFKAGVVPNVVNGMLQPEEVRAVVADSRARMLVTDAERWSALAAVRQGLGVEAKHVLLAGDPPAGESDGDGLRSFAKILEHASDRYPMLDLAPETLACLLYTSGTTGRPKGVMLTHRNIVDNAVTFAAVHFGAEDRLLIAAPLFHCWGLINGVIAMFAVGGSAVAVRRYQTKTVLDLIERARPTQLLGVPTMINYMARSPGIVVRDRSSLRAVLCAAAPMPHELIDVLVRDWRVGYAESYGLTETSPVITTTTPAAMRPGSCGRAMGDTELKVVDAEGKALPAGAVGELWARGTAISAGYFQQPEATRAVFTADGWFKTGDVVRIDDEGYVYIVDRAKDMINVGGEKVYPRDVEELLHRHPAVADAVVVGILDPDLGEVVKALVVRGPGQALSADEVIAYLRPLVARFKVPRVVEFVDAVPRSPSGKALRRLLREIKS